MHAGQLFDSRLRRLFPDQIGEFLGFQGAQDGAQAIGAFGVVRAGVMFQADGMRDEGRGQVRIPCHPARFAGLRDAGG